MLAAAFPIVPVLILVLLIILIGGLIFLISQIWDKAPWWRSSPKPRKQLKNDKERVKMWKLHAKYPEAFPMPVDPTPLPGPPNVTHPLPPVEQEIIDDFVKDVVDKDHL